MDAVTTSAAAGRTTLFHRRHLKQQVGKSLGHFGPAVVLLLGVAPVLSGTEPFSVMVLLEFVVGGAYLVLMVRELLHLRHNPFHRESVAWLELAAAGILALESYHIWHRHHEAELAGGPHKFHVLPWLYAAVAVVFVVMAFRMKYLQNRRFLHLHPDGFGVRTSLLGRAHHLRWHEVAGAEAAGPADVVIRQPSGHTRRISFEGVADGPAHRDRLLAHLRAAPAGNATE